MTVPLSMSTKKCKSDTLKVCQFINNKKLFLLRYKNMESFKKPKKIICDTKTIER